jgi:hypothetical protein
MFNFAAGKVGDVFLLYRFCVYSTIWYEKWLFRGITNSKASFEKLYKLYREDGKYSILEQY